MKRQFALFLFLVSTSSANADDVVRIWVKAFIPNSHPTLPNYVLAVPGQTGKFMVPAPYKDSAMQKLLELQEACFATDHRSFSDNPAASARVTTDFKLKVAAQSVSLQPSSDRGLQFTDLTHKLNCTTGKDLQAARTGSVEDCGVGEPAVAGNTVTITMSCRSKNPFFNLPGGPSIDYNGVFTYDRAAKTLAFAGDVGSFPAFEAYASINGKPAKAIFKLPPGIKATTWSLYDLWLGVNTRKLRAEPVKLQ